MTKKTSHFLKKIFSLYFAFSLFFSHLSPFILFAAQVQASNTQNTLQNLQEVDTIAFNLESNELSLRVKSTTAVSNDAQTQYALYYEAEGVMQASFGMLDSHESTLFLGSQSNDDFVKHNPSRIIIKLFSSIQSQKTLPVQTIQLEMEYEKSNDNLPYVRYHSDSYDLSISENMWLTHGMFKVQNIVLNKQYQFPLDENVSVTFTSLPEEMPEAGGSVQMREITLSDEQVEELGAVSSTAYEITSSMENGTFTYDLTLPNPADESGAQVAVQYSEDGEEFAPAKGEDFSIEEKDGSPVVKITGLDHFTVFVVTFEEEDADPDDGTYNNLWFDYLGGTVTRVPSGTDGITSAGGDFHAKITGPVFTRWGGYSNVFPSAGYDTRVDVFLDMDLADGVVDKRFDFSSAISRPNGSHLRDFIIHLGTSLTTAGEWSVTASNNAPGNPHNSSLNPATISESGWYTIEHQFRKNSSNELVVTINLYKKSDSSLVGSWVRTNASDIIGDTVGGNLYGWFTGHRFDFDWLAIDNATIELNTAIAAPTLLAPEYGTAYKSSDLPKQQSWTSVPGAVRYHYQGCAVDPLLTDNLCPVESVKHTTTRTTTFRNIGATANEGATWWQVRAEDAVGHMSSWSEPLLFYVDNNHPTLSNVTMLVNGVETTQAKAGDTVRVLADVIDDISGVNRIQIWVRDFPYTGKQIDSGLMSHLGDDTYYFDFIVPLVYTDGTALNETIDGNYFNFRPWDNAGNSHIGWRNNFTVDLTKPSIEILSPAENTHHAGQLEIQVKASDSGTGIGQFVVNLRNAGGHLASCVNQHGGGVDELVVSCLIDTSEYSDGEYTIRTNVRDVVGNLSTTLERNFVFDNTLPVIEYISPDSGEYYSEDVDVLIQITEDNPDQYRFRIRGMIDGVPTGQFYNTSWVSIDETFDGTFSYIWDSTTAPYGDAMYRLDFEFRDKAGNERKLNRSFNVDNTAPNAPTNLSVTPDSPTNQTSQTWNWTAATDIGGSGILGYWVSIYDVLTETVFQPLTFIGNVTSHGTNLLEGVWKFFVQAQDTAGNVGGSAESAEYEVDTTPPLVSITSHANGDVISGVQQILGSIIEKNPGHYNISLYPGHDEASTWNFSNRVWQQTVNGTTVVEHEIDTTNFSDGPYMIRLAARDAAGNRDPMPNAGSGISVEIVKVIIDNTGPDISDVSMLVNDVSATLAKPGDTIKISARIVDEYLDVDRTRIIIRKIPTSADTYVVPNQAMTQDVDDSDLYHFEFVLPSTYTSGLDLDQAINGHFFRVRAWDTNNNRSQTGTNRFTIDSVVPQSSITGPGEADPENPNTIIVNEWDGLVLGTAMDPNPGSGLAGVELSIVREIGEVLSYWDGSTESWSSDPNAIAQASSDDMFATWNYQISESPLLEATYTVTARAYDVAGNKESSSHLTIVLDKTIPEVDISVSPTNPDGENNWYKTRPQVTLTASDAFSGLKEIQYQWNSQTGVWQTYNTPFFIPAEGTYILYYRAIDKATNATDVGIKTLRWDETDLNQGPLNVAANPSKTSGSTSVISWDAAQDNIGIFKYDVVWKLRDSSVQYGKSVSSATRETTIDRMTQEGEWDVYVRAFDAVGNMKEGKTKVTVIQTAPAAPTLTLTGSTAGTASLAWNAVDSAVRYIVYYGVNSGEYIFAADVGNVTEFTVQDLTAGSYFFMVRAVNDASTQSDNSNEVATGAIPGAPGVGGDAITTPAAGFQPAGEVLGDEDDAESAEVDDDQLATDDDSRSGMVAGVTDEACSGLSSNLPWILLSILILGGIALEFILKRQAGLHKFAISGSLFAITALAFYMLGNTQCADGLVMNIVTGWFWAVSAGLAVLIRLAGYAFIEEIEI